MNTFFYHINWIVVAHSHMLQKRTLYFLTIHSILKIKIVQAKNSWNQINDFFREITFLAVLNFFPVQKLIFGHF